MTAAVTTLPAAGCRCVRVSPDGTSVVTVGAGRVQVWDASSGELGWARDQEALDEFPVEAVWGGRSDSITLLVSGRLVLLDAVTGAEVPLPDDLAGRTDITAIALAPNGLTLAVGAHEGVIMLWQQDIGRVVRLRGGGDPVTALAWRPTSTELCVARSRSLQLWKPDTQVMISSMNIGDVHPLRLVWTADGDLVVVMGLMEVRALSMSTRGDSARPLVVRGRLTGLGVSRSGSTLLVGMPDGSVELLSRQLRSSDVPLAAIPAELVEPANLHVNETGLVAVRAGPETVGLHTLADTKLAAAQQRGAVALRRWAARLTGSAGRAATGSPPVPTTVAERAGFAWADDGWYLLGQDSGEVARYSGDGHRLWAAKAGPGPLSARGGVVAVGVDGARLTVLDGRTGKKIASVDGTGQASWFGGVMAVVAPNHHDLLVHDRPRSHRTIPVPDQAHAPAWSPDGTRLAAATANAVVVWDGQTLARLLRLDIGAGHRHASVAWSPDGEHLALVRPGAPVVIWDTTTWRAGQHTIPSAREGGAALAWSPDSRLVAVPSRSPIGAVELWDVARGGVVMTVPPPPGGRTPVAAVHWAADGRFSVSHDNGAVVRWTVTPPPSAAAPPPQLAAIVTATAATGTMVALPLLADLFALLLGQDAGPLGEFDRHPGVTMLRGLRWPPDAVVGLAVLVAAGLPADEDMRPPRDVAQDELRAAVTGALDGMSVDPGAYEPPTAALLGEFDRIDDSLLVLATLLGPDAVAAAPDLLTRVRNQSFSGWSFAPRQRRLLGLRSALRADGSSGGHGVGDARAGIARHGQLPSLLPSQLALPRKVLGAKMSRDELLFRTRQGDLPVEAQSVVLVLDDTPAAFGAVGVTLRIVANLLAGIAIRRRRRGALVSLSSAKVMFLAEMTDLVHLWAGGSVERPDLPSALTAANAAAAELSDPLGGLPRLVLLTQPYLTCPSRPGLHVIRVQYPGIPVTDPAPRTHVLSTTAGSDEIHEVIGAILSGRS